MSTLHIFNPEHEWSLAQGRVGGSPPRAAVRLRHDLSYLPTLLAEDGDKVLVDDKVFALHMLRQWEGPAAHVELVEAADVWQTKPIDAVRPWGWDANICHELRSLGTDDSLLPDDEQLMCIRELSHRAVAGKVLSALTENMDTHQVVGSSWLCTTMAEVEQHLQHLGSMVIKAPWSSSGRGVMLCHAGVLTDQQQRRVNNILLKQGGVMCEPLYDRVADFAMEFVAHDDGSVDYQGLSVFTTTMTQYAGNVIASEDYKYSLLTSFLPVSLLSDVRSLLPRLLQAALQGHYQGPLGVDMMVVRLSGNAKGAPLYAMHPCVEINLRFTMGHVALALAQRMPETKAQMQIVCNQFFQMRIYTLYNGVTSLICSAGSNNHR